MTNIRPGVQLQNMQEPYRRVVEDIVNLSMKVEEDMELKEAIEEVKRLGVVGIWEPDEFAFGMTEECRTAIATILNAVVKGELK